jgi:hypothetical protein
MERPVFVQQDVSRVGVSVKRAVAQDLTEAAGREAVGQLLPWYGRSGEGNGVRDGPVVHLFKDNQPTGAQVHVNPGNAYPFIINTVGPDPLLGTCLVSEIEFFAHGVGELVNKRQHVHAQADGGSPLNEAAQG